MYIALKNAWVLYKREYKILQNDKEFMPKEFRLDVARLYLLYSPTKKLDLIMSALILQQ